MTRTTKVSPPRGWLPQCCLSRALTWPTRGSQLFRCLVWGANSVPHIICELNFVIIWEFQFCIIHSRREQNWTSRFCEYYTRFVKTRFDENAVTPTSSVTPRWKSMSFLDIADSEADGKRALMRSNLASPSCLLICIISGRGNAVYYEQLKKVPEHSAGERSLPTPLWKPSGVSRARLLLFHYRGSLYPVALSNG